jgi:hypothetical protein
MCCPDNLLILILSAVSHLCDFLYAQYHICSADANGNGFFADLLYIMGFIQDHNIVLEGKR